tara:strand:+ start:699 stop:1040 length:342 start_codon:yes stop_codon:yes gene_type:complete
MWTFKKGDLIAKVNPALGEPIQIGIIIEDNKNSFSIKWTSFNKTFFMEKQGEIFQELNNIHLLNIDKFHRSDRGTGLVLLNSNYIDGKNKKKFTDAGDGRSFEKDYQTDRRLY